MVRPVGQKFGIEIARQFVELLDTCTLSVENVDANNLESVSEVLTAA